MTEVKNMETMIATENQQEATEVMAFLGELEPQEKKDFLVFMQGIRFAKGMAQKIAPQSVKRRAQEWKYKEHSMPSAFLKRWR